MKKEIILRETEIKKMLKKFLNLEIEPTFYLEGGVVRPQQIRVIYYETIED